MRNQRINQSQISAKLPHIFLFILIGLIAVVVIVYIVLYSTPSDKDIKNQNIEIVIDSSKDSYERGEPVSINFSVVNHEEFALINIFGLETLSREGFDKKIYGGFSLSSRNERMAEIGPLLEKSVDAVRITDDVIGSQFKYFYEEGTYIYSLSIYDCSVVKKRFKKDCVDIYEQDELEQVAQLTPIKSISKTVVVKGGENPSECKIDEECTRICDSCEIGKQICVEELCIDCFSDIDCKEEHICVDDECITE